MAGDIDWATRTASALLMPLGRRWDHVQAVAMRAREVAGACRDALDGLQLVSAAYLHDIGYAPDIAETGFHPLDGARFVRRAGYPEIAVLVAHHSGARNEARRRGMGDVLESEFPYEDSLAQRALTYCDLTNGPAGQPMTVDERLAEIVQRYGEQHVVGQAIIEGRPYFLELETAINALLAQRMTGSSPLR